MKKKIIITGGSGFIGTNLVDYYKDKFEVLNLDINKPRNKDHKIYWKEVDILNLNLLSKVIHDFNPHYILHMAARTDLEGLTLEDYKANTQGVSNVISSIKELPFLEKIIFASSRLVCEIGYEPKDEFDYKPSTIYGESKIIGEKIVRDSESLFANWIIVRPTSLWGPWFDIPYKNFFDVIEKKYYYHPKNKSIYKKFGFVLNSVFVLDKLLKNSSLDKKTVYLSDFEQLEVKTWANLISNHFHKENIKEIPLFILKFISFVGDFSKVLGVKNPPLTNFRLNNLLTQMNYNTTNVEKVVGVLPYNLEQGTYITYKWLEKQKSTKI